jgi:hypothetical protein
MKIATGIILGVLLLGVVAFNSRAQAPAPGSLPQAESPESIKQSNQEKVAEIKKQIAGKENQPAETLFKNIQLFRGLAAGRLLMVMQMGFSNSLGVSCSHCHVGGEWEKEDKPQKQIARDMMKMVGTINNDLLKNIQNLKGPNSIVNCTTCHRGQVKPALDLEQPKPAK